GGCANSGYALWTTHASPENSDKSRLHTKSVASGARLASPEDVAAFDAAVELATQLRYPEAERKFRPLLERFVAADNVHYASETLFWLGYCSEKQGRLDAAEQFYNRVIAEYPQTPAADQAQRRLEELARGDGVIRVKRLSK
ncbi:MAG: tetratricopeptide repeat protein, partial [Phycisphaerae bacterium]|nr:tetratricopeptide repeat protein [Phycisphaerae bacterium]